MWLLSKVVVRDLETLGRSCGSEVVERVAFSTMDSATSGQELSINDVSQQQSALSLPSLALHCDRQSGHQQHQDVPSATKENPTAHAAIGSAAGASTLPTAFMRANYCFYQGPKLGDAVRYRECQKNHEANVGGHAVDGCEEFASSAIDVDAGVRCGTCGCHRSYHRLEVIKDAMPICMVDPTSGVTVYFKKQGV